MGGKTTGVAGVSQPHGTLPASSGLTSFSPYGLVTVVPEPTETMQLRYVAKEKDPYSSHTVILARAGVGRGRRLLDVGAAQGVLAQRFTEAGFEVTCIEGDPQLAALAKDRCREVIVADLDGRLPSLVGRFDVIVFGDVLEHLKNPMEVLRRFSQYLQPEGKVIVSVPNIAHAWIRMGLLLGRFEYMERGILDRTHLRFFTLATFRRFLADAGLVVKELTATPVPLLLIVPQRYHGWWLRTLHALNAAVARCWKTMFGYQFVAVARAGKLP
jgi:2-polyprenyl-3-methyl-5-hydroxy-6-metoxy-1,4-benzoquinol methylase